MIVFSVSFIHVAGDHTGEQRHKNASGKCLPSPRIHHLWPYSWARSSEWLAIAYAIEYKRRKRDVSVFWHSVSKDRCGPQESIWRAQTTHSSEPADGDRSSHSRAATICLAFRDPYLQHCSPFVPPRRETALDLVSRNSGRSRPSVGSATDAAGGSCK